MKTLLIILGLLVIWFVPWVLVLYTGVLVYFPYHADNSSRFMRVAGPVPGYFTQHAWAKAEDIPRACREALVAAEDTRFYEHAGIDLVSMELAMKRNEKRGKIRWGGSTITQQLVKNAFLSRKRSYLRKAREATGALLLNLVMTKYDQVTWYFNIVEFGPEIYGISEASHYYFKRPTKKLTPPQCALLVGILPSPRKSGPSIKTGHYTRYLQKRLNYILKRLQITRTLPPHELNSMLQVLK